MARALLHRQRDETGHGPQGHRGFSDGIDTGSDIRFSDLIETVQSAETVVYAIKYASPARFFSPGTMLGQALSHGLERLARETGGLTFANPGRKNSDVFSRIESDLRNLYVLGFTPPAGARDGAFHKFDVRAVGGGDFVIRFRAGNDWATTGNR